MSEQQPSSSPAPGPAQATGGQANEPQGKAAAQSTTQGPDHQLVSMGLVDQQTLQQAQAHGLGGGFLLNLLKKYVPMILGEVLGQLQGGGTTPSAAQTSPGGRR